MSTAPGFWTGRGRPGIDTGAGQIVPLAADAARALAQGDDGASVRLVWRPSRASRSSLFPLWEVTSSGTTTYVDMFGRVLRSLD